jgi:hydroxysqualene dehydroxylase
MEPEPGIVVIGGGWAGLSCAADLAERGLPVTLLEERPRLGGRACSFADAVTGDEIDNGQHLFMACFSESLRFLERIGTADRIAFQAHLEVPLLDPAGRRSAFRFAPLPSPLHLLTAILGHGALTLRDKIRLLRSLHPLRRRVRGNARRERHAGREPAREATVEEWLDALGQTPGSRRGLWHPMAIATLNEDPARASSLLFEAVLRESLVSGRSGSRLGLSKVPLSRLVDPALRRYLEERGGRVILNAAVARLRLEGGRVRGVRLRDGSEISAQAVVSAVPHHVLPRILPEEIPAGDPFFGRAAAITSSPILSIHLWYDREVMESPFVGLLDSPIHWIFASRAASDGKSPAGARLALVVSGARDLVERPASDLANLAAAEVRRYLPRARPAVLRHTLVLKERLATFAPCAGIGALRLPQETPVPNLVLAGDWTDTGLPGTLESAALSGHRGAELVHQRLGRAA